MLSENIYGQVSALELIICALGILCTMAFGYMNASDKEEESTGKVLDLGKYLTFNLDNLFFHILSSFLLLSFAQEVGLSFIDSFINLPIKTEGKMELYLAAVSGLGGGMIIGGFLETLKGIKERLYRK